MGIEPKVVSESEPITEIVKITQPVGQKNVAGTQVNPATEDTLALVKTAVEIIDNFISGARGLVTEDNSGTIKDHLVPLAVASQHGVAETADVNILATSITPTNTPCLFRVMVMLETAGVFSAILINGGVSKTLKLNASNSLLANCAYMFDILVHSGDTVNFQTSVSGNVTLRCQEIAGGVQ